MELGGEDSREEGRAGVPGASGAPGIIDVASFPVPDVPAVPEADVAAVPMSDASAVPETDVPAVPEAPHVPLWGPPSGGRAVALWGQNPPPADEPAVDDEPPALGPPAAEPRYRLPALIGIGLAGAMLLLGLVAVTGWPGTDSTDSLANRSGPGGPGPTGSDGQPVELPPSQPATPVSFAPGGDVVRPEPRRARIVDPRSGRVVIVDLPPGTTVDTSSGQVVVRVTGSPTTSIVTPTSRPSTTTTTHTTTTTEDTTTTTEDTTTTTEDTTTTTDPPPTSLPDETIP